MSDRSAAPSITLVQYPGLTRDTTLSSPCAKVHMALRFKGLVYETRNVYSPWEARRHNPRGRVPVLLIGEDTVADSTDIVTALEARFPDPPLEPAGAAERALSKVLEDWADEVLYFYGVYVRFCVPECFERIRRSALSRLPVPARWLAPFVLRRTMRRRAMGQGVALKGEEVVHRESRECYRAIADLLGSRQFLVGDRLTRADLAVAAVLDQHRLARLTPRLAAEIEALPAVAGWLDRVHARAPSAAVSAVAVRGS